MLNIQIANERQNQQFEHEVGALEIGRGPQRQLPRIVVEDSFVSRDHLELEEMPNGQLRVKNLSQRQHIQMPDGSRLAFGASRELDLPTHLDIGRTSIDVERLATEAFEEESYQTLARPVQRVADQQAVSIRALGESPPAEKIASWLEAIITLQRSPASSREFYDQTARALVQLVGLDLGMVLLRNRTGWDIAGHYAASSMVSSRYSRTLVEHVLSERRTFFQDLKGPGLQAESLRNIDAVVASPIFGLQDDIAGVLYGTRTWRSGGGIRPLEAQLVQLLAGALGANLARTVATRTRVRFEQFFSAELVQELERDPNLLEGRHQEVTVLFSDVRNFTAMSEQLGPEQTCRIVRDIIARLSEQIVVNGGTIVNYIGDGIMAMWNAPVKQDDHVVRACRAALAMHEQMPALNERWLATVGRPLAVGIGLNTGPALVGNTGGDRRLQYGPFGLTVNLASRIETATKKVGVPVLISTSVKEQLRGAFRTRSVGSVALAGVSEEVPLHELLGMMSTTIA
ncbi:MAG: hypothetical protein K2R98_04805 [Gemmataceae bacterium]|nr:hypothetical protein [Gemmataceae bacterium]